MHDVEVPQFGDDEIPHLHHQILVHLPLVLSEEFVVASQRHEQGVHHQHQTLTLFLEVGVAVIIDD